MTGEFEYSLPPVIRRISQTFRRFGWISFWIQVVLGVVAGGILIAAIIRQSSRPGGGNPGESFGLYLACAGLITVYIGAFWAFRYTRIAQRLQGRDGSQRPLPKDIYRILRQGLYISLGGMLFTILGAQAIAGALLGKIATQPQGPAAFGVAGSADNFVQLLDIAVVQANTNTLLAHFGSLACTLWVLQAVEKTQGRGG